MCIVIVACLAFFLTMVYRASRQPGTKRPTRERMLTGVRGGRHIAVGGRSVAPDRNAPVSVLADAEAAVPPEAAVAAPPAPAVPTPRGEAPEAATPEVAVAGKPVPSQRSGHADLASRATTEPGA